MELQYKSYKELAAKYGMSYMGIYGQRRKGKITPAYRLDGKPLFDEKEFVRYNLTVGHNTAKVKAALKRAAKKFNLVF
jgi:hypothetical protein